MFRLALFKGLFLDGGYDGGMLLVKFGFCWDGLGHIWMIDDDV